jgi:hypothetical protein
MGLGYRNEACQICLTSPLLKNLLMQIIIVHLRMVSDAITGDSLVQVDGI